MKKKELIAGGIIFVLSIALRLYSIDNPIADWHSWRQVDTAAVARNFETKGIDILRPRYDDYSNIQSGKDNLQGYRMVEAPLYQLTAVLVHRLMPGFSLEWVLRMTSAVSTGLSILFLGYLLRLYVGRFEALVGSVLYAILPFSIYYGRSVLPDSFAVCFVLLSFVLLTRPGKFSFLAAALCGAISLLVRPMAIFLLLPVVVILYGRFRFTKFFFLGLCMYGMILLFPLAVWRSWIGQFPEGIPASNWLLNNNGIRFKGAWFHWLFAKRVGELILGYWGLIPFGIGLLWKGKDKFFMGVWVVGGLLYFIIFAGGNVQHDYYQALIIPIVIWCVARGSGLLYRMGGLGLCIISLIFGLAFSWYTVRTFFWINRPEIVEAGRAADRMLPKDAKVIAPYNGDTTFLYQTNRPGWPIGFEIEKKIQMGATAYVTVSPTDSDLETKELAETYTVLVRNDTYAIIDLTKKRE